MNDSILAYAKAEDTIKAMRELIAQQKKLARLFYCFASGLLIVGLITTFMALFSNTVKSPQINFIDGTIWMFTAIAFALAVGKEARVYGISFLPLAILHALFSFLKATGI